MTIQNQRLILNLAKRGEISGISNEQVDFDYSDNEALQEEAGTLHKAGFWVLTKGNSMTVAS